MIFLTMVDFQQLPHLYTQVMNHPKCSDDLLRVTESKLLQYKVNYLHTLPITDEFIATKGKVRTEVNELVRGAILLQLPDEFVWMLYMEEQDCENMCKLSFHRMVILTYLNKVIMISPS